MNQTIFPFASVSVRGCLGARFDGKKTLTHAPLGRHRRFALTLVLVGFLSVLATGRAQAADVELELSNTGSETSFATDLNWSEPGVPSSGNNYFVADGFSLRSTTNSGGGNVTFLGDSLTLGDGTTSGNLALIASSRSVTVGDLVLNNGIVSKGGNTDSTGTLQAGTLTLAAGGGTFFSNASRHLTVNASTNVVGAGRLRLDTATVALETSTITINSTGTYTGGTIWTSASAGDTVNLGSTTALGAAAGSLNLNNTVGLLNLGGNNIGVGKLDGLAGSVIRGGTTGGSSTLTVGNTGTGNDGSPSSFAGVIQNGTGGRVLGLAKTGSGTQTLAGANTYTGATTISGGTLAIATGGTINSSTSIGVTDATLAYNSATALTVAPTLNGAGTGSRAVLAGTGTINAALALNNVGDTLSPGNSPGIMSFALSQEWNSFSYDWELNDWSDKVPGTNIDQVQITGSLDLTGASLSSYIVNVLSLTAGDVPGDVPGFTEANNTWTILTTTGGITGFDASFWTVDDTGFSSTPAAGGTWTVDQDGDNLVLNYAVVPEPGTFVMIACGGAVAFAALRRRMRA